MTTMTISLPDQVAQKINIEARKKDFATRSEFIRNLLRDYFSKVEEFELEEFKPIPLAQLRLELTKTGKYSQKFIDSVIDGFKESSVYGHKTA